MSSLVEKKKRIMVWGWESGNLSFYQVLLPSHSPIIKWPKNPVWFIWDLPTSCIGDSFLSPHFLYQMVPFFIFFFCENGMEISRMYIMRSFAKITFQPLIKQCSSDIKNTVPLFKKSRNAIRLFIWCSFFPWTEEVEVLHFLRHGLLLAVVLWILN